MARIDIVYASHDGQTRKIACVLRDTLTRDFGCDATLRDLDACGAPPIRQGRDVFTVVAAPIRYGYPLSRASAFLRGFLEGGPPDRLAILLVCLVARKPNRQSAQTNGYLRRWLERLEVKPALSAAIAGKLNYPLYRWYDRWMMRAILALSGGPTDVTAEVEYTDWHQVGEIAAQIAHLSRLTGDPKGDV